MYTKGTTNSEGSRLRFQHECSNTFLLIPLMKKKNVRINNIKKISVYFKLCCFKSILGCAIFNIFINEILIWSKNSELHNFAGDNTVISSSKSIKNFVKHLKEESKRAIG